MKIESTQNVLVEYDGDVVWLTLNRPDVLNAVNDALLRDLTAAVRGVTLDQSRVIVLTGAGRAFCAGGDHSTLSDWASEGLGATGEGARPEASDLIDALLRLEKPIIAAVNGAAIGLGAVIALYCDYIVAAEHAKIGDRHASIGLVSGVDSAIWTALLGPLRAQEFMMTGRLLNGVEAAEIGLVNRAVPGDELRAAALEYAAKLATLPPYAVQKTKASVNRYLRFMTDLILPVSYAWEQLSMVTQDHQEALLAFKEKRPGNYTGR
jgi:enoyl-CoA hydratase